MAAIAACYNGPVADGERLVHPLRRLGPPVDDGIRPMRYTDVQRIFAEIPFGLHNYWKGHFIREMTDDVVDATVEAFETMTSDHSAILIEAPHGAVRRVPADASAFGQRDARFNASALAIWEPSDDPDRHIQWTRRYANAIGSGSIWIPPTRIVAGMTEPDWKEVRRRARRRAGATMALIVGPIVLFVWAIKIFEPHDYPAGDMRNEPLFWVLAGVVALVLIGAIMVGSVRALRGR
ncbi:MAG: hypothetical protein WD508_03235 [Chloroflexota bacterium]